ncbi:MAG: hypothetical protein OEY11_14045 [Gammaproteobacteria bacterium]|nr:hypothetical protein [Gammaproteobacteria bacterium]
MSSFYIRLKSSRLFWFLCLLVLTVLAETVLLAAFTTHLPTTLSFLLLDRFDFFLKLFTEAPVDALTLIFVDRPFMVITAMQKEAETAIWELRYYGYTLVVHLFVAAVFSHVMSGPECARLNFKAFPLLASVLLIFSSLFLYLSSCCAVGGNWVFETMLLAILFNPVTASDAFIVFYGFIASGFNWLQTALSVLAVVMMFNKSRFKADVRVNK